MQPIWIICPVLNNLAMTMDAIGDFLDQSVPTRVLIINQGSDQETREALERQAELAPDRLFIWSHMPSLPSLGATWNRALDFVWETGGDKALVVNNDVRLHPYTVEGLMGVLNLRREQPYLFVSAVAVTKEQFAAQALESPAPQDPPHPDSPMYWYDYAKREVTSKGGPDFSCFMISRAGHQKYRFDESFIPAYCEDLDMHRRYMLGGDGDKIFSVNLPYLHFASGTLKDMTPDQRMKKERAIDGSRQYYRKKWGGEVNQETFYFPFGESPTGIAADVAQSIAPVGPTTPELQRWWQTAKEPA
jgi:hypothetical protein